MAPKRRLVVEARPDGRWRISPATEVRGPQLFDSKAAALAEARATAKQSGSVLVVKGDKGRIEQQSS